MSDDGYVHSGYSVVVSDSDIERIRLFELGKYADYVLNCHVILRQHNPDVSIPLQPFSFPA